MTRVMIKMIEDNVRDDFSRALSIILSFEGGLVNDQSDPGGITKYGISKRSYPDLDIANLTIEQATEIYRRDFWDDASCYAMRWPVNLIVFDGCINHGFDAMTKLLQKTIGVSQDGLVGEKTIGTINAQPPLDLSLSLLAARALRYTGTRNFDRYGRGWLRRLFGIAINCDKE